MSENQLSCSNVVKVYGKKEVLHNLDLTLDKGKIYGLIGRNGAGKTTLLSILSGQNDATKGEVSVAGLPVWENEEALAKICFSRELNPMSANGANAMKVKDYLKAAAVYLPGWDQQMADRLIQEFGLEVNKRINKLSKGMLSMVTIVVALASKAEYTLLDEPVAGLDVVARENFYRILLEEFEESGRTFVVSTHIIEEAADVFEEVIILDQGQIILKENTVDLLDRACHISGMAEEVNTAVAGMKVYHPEKMGRSKGVTVLFNSGETIKDYRNLSEKAADGRISVQPMSLQQVFVALCGKEAQSE